MIEKALDLAARGFPVFPVHSPVENGLCSCRNPKCTSPAKHPRTKRGLNEATTNPDYIKQWWNMWPDANIGMPTGKTSGIIVVDADDLSTLTDKSLPYTAKVKTGRGYHFYYKCPEDGMRTMKLEPGLDLRADGAYVLGPGSKHISGTTYNLENEEAGINEAPEWVLTATEMVESELSPMLNHKAAIQNGERNNVLFKEAASLRGRGYDETVIFAAVSAMNLERCNPPLSDREIRILCESACRYLPNDEKPKEKVKEVEEVQPLGAYLPLKNPILDDLFGEAPEVEWLVPDMLTRGSLIALAGLPGVGKSYLSYYISMALATGTDILDKPINNTVKILYFDQENSRSDRVKYERRCYYGLDKPDKDLLNKNFWSRSFELGDKDWIKMAKDRIEEIQPDLIFFDTATPCFRIEDENDNAEAARIIDAIRRLMNVAKTNPTAVVLKHAKILPDNGGYTLRGAKAWEGQVDGIIYQTTTPGRPRTDGLKNTQLVPGKTRAFGLSNTIKIVPEWIDDEKTGLRLSVAE